MALPTNYKDILLQKDDYILKATSKLNANLSTYQNAILREITQTLLGELDVDAAGSILNTLKNYRIVSEVDTVIQQFVAANSGKIQSTILTTARKIGAFNATYFTIAASDQTLNRINAVKKATETKMLGRLGYINDRIISGGFLENFTNPAGIVDNVAQTVINAITGQTGVKDLVSTLDAQLTGGENLGIMERRLNGFAHDVFNQYDRGYAGNMATEFGMEYFVYEGGLVEDTRDFCKEMNGRVFHVSETEAWRTWTPAKITRGFEPKQKCLTCIPSYLDFAGYEPLIDLGGYNCRHNKAYISNELAYRLRPELKDMKFN